MDQDIITIIKQAENQVESQLLKAQKDVQQKLSTKEKEMELKFANLEQSLRGEIEQVKLTAQQELLEIEKKETEKRDVFSDNKISSHQPKAKKFIFDFILKKLWLVK